MLHSVETHDSEDQLTGFRIAGEQVLLAWHVGRGCDRCVADLSRVADAESGGRPQGFRCPRSDARRKTMRVAAKAAKDLSTRDLGGNRKQALADRLKSDALPDRCGGESQTHDQLLAESHPSVPNYIAMTSGSTQGLSGNPYPSDAPLGVASIFSQLGTQWRALEESMPSNCDPSNEGLYDVNHNAAASPPTSCSSARARTSR